jgi:hypothetical protein
MLDTLENVKERLGITTDDYDDFLEQQITVISDTIEAYCRRRFLSADYIETFYKEDNRPSSHLRLFFFPASEIESIEEDGELVDEEEYRLHKPTATISRKNRSLFNIGEETVVKYTAGYETCPSPVLSVLDALVFQRYSKKISGVGLDFGSDVQRISIPGAISIDFDYSLKNNEQDTAFGMILGDYLNVLDYWRSERAIVGSGTLEYVEEDV